METTHPAQMFADAVRQHQAGALEAAERLCRQVLAGEPRHADSLHLLGIISSQNGRNGAAAELIGRAIAINDTVAAYHSNLGNVFQAQGLTDKAVASYQRALALRPDFAEAHFNLANILAAGRQDAAAGHYAQAVALRPDFAAAHANFAHLLRAQGKLEDAAKHYGRAVELQPQDAETRFNLGNVLHSLGQLDTAAACYDEVLAQRPEIAEAHSNLGNVRKDQGDEAAAKACFERAIALKPDYAEAHYNLGNLLSDQGDVAGAAAGYRRALEIRPDLAEAHYNLGNALKDQDQLDAAVAHYEQAIKLRSGYAEALLNLGNTLKAQDKPVAALERYRQAVAVRPDFTDAQLALGGLLLLVGQADEAHQLFRDVHRRRPVSRKLARGRRKGEFSVLLLTAPGAGHTPSSYLVSRAAYDSNFLLMVQDGSYDVAALRPQADVVVNLISDVDQSRTILPQVVDLAERLGRPVINHPRKILATGRAMVAERLTGIPRCLVPRTVRVSGAALAAGELPAGVPFPLLMRLCGSHGGDDFEKIADAAGVIRFAMRNVDADHYVSEYVPYESADGRFRKYRLIFVGGEIFPYHLAIADQWKVHYFRTDMANQDALRREEAGFIDDPHSVFDAGRWAALQAIQDAIDLDYFGIDCAIDPAGDLLVFEVNATMLVHDEQGIFAYKAPAIARIKRAFDAMLAKAAKGQRTP